MSAAAKDATRLEMRRVKSRGYSAAWRARYPEKVAAMNRVSRGTFIDRIRNIRARYGLTAEAYFALLGEQNGLCAICGMTNDGFALSVDHRHVDGYSKLSADEKAGLVRGLLCAPCNTLIGFCKEEPEHIARKADALRHAAAYLKRETMTSASIH